MDDRRDPWAAPLPRTRSDRVRALLPPALLVVVALLGVQRSVNLDQSSWQGASFGMFATYDNETSRTAVVTVTGPDGPVRAALPQSLRDDETRLLVVPTDGRAAALARSVLHLGVDQGVTEVLVEVFRIRLTRGGGLRLGVELVAAGAAVA